MYKYLFFDFDGTICDTSEGIYKTFREVFPHYGLNVDESLYPRYIGPPLSDTFYSYFKDKDKAYEAVALFRSVYTSKYIGTTKLYDGIENAFKALSSAGYKVCVATCKKHEEAVALLKKFGIYDYVTFTSGLCYNVRETKREVLQYALDEMKISPKDCVMIGDTDFDVDGAEQVGMDCIVCKWGFGDYGKMAQKNIVFFASTPEEVVEFVTKE